MKNILPVTLTSYKFKFTIFKSKKHLVEVPIYPVKSNLVRHSCLKKGVRLAAILFSTFSVVPGGSSHDARGPNVVDCVRRVNPRLAHLRLQNRAQSAVFTLKMGYLQLFKS